MGHSARKGFEMKVERIRRSALSYIVTAVGLLAGGLHATLLGLYDFDRAVCGEEIDAGKQLMTLKGVSYNAGLPNCSSWHFPASISCNGDSFRVVGCSASGEFSLLSNPTNSSSVVARGAVVRVPCRADALALGFGRLAYAGLDVHGVATSTQLVNPHSNTNAFFLTGVNPHADGLSVLVWRNLYLTMSGTTNIQDLAVTLLNAGLPASERITTPSVQ